MDTLIISIVALAGICSYVFCTLKLRASFALTLFSWIVAIPWLGIYAVRKLWMLNSAELVSWQGSAEIGPVTLILIVIGLSLVVAGGKRRVAGL